MFLYDLFLVQRPDDWFSMLRTCSRTRNLLQASVEEFVFGKPARLEGVGRKARRVNQSLVNKNDEV